MFLLSNGVCVCKINQNLLRYVWCKLDPFGEELHFLFLQDAVKQSIEQEAGNGDNTGIHHLQQLLPFVYPPGAAQEGTADEGKPLDLSATSQTKSSRDVENGSPPSKPVVELKVPQIMKSG